jgi:hypothetical protein
VYRAIDPLIVPPHEQFEQRWLTADDLRNQCRVRHALRTLSFFFFLGAAPPPRESGGDEAGGEASLTEFSRLSQTCR